MLAALDLWQPGSDIDTRLDELDDTPTYFRLAVKQHGLRIRRIEEGLSLLKRLNLPAILECVFGDSSTPKYATLTEMRCDGLTLSVGGNPYQIAPGELLNLWSGAAYLPWKDFLQMSGTLPRDASPDAIIALKMLLRSLGFSSIDVSAAYDDPTREAVERIQEKYGIRVDGIVGPITKIALYSERKTFTMPRIAVAAKEVDAH